MIDRFADVVKKSRAFCKVHVQPQLLRHKPRKLSDLDGVAVHVLTVARAEFEPSDEFDDLGMQPEDPHFEHGVLARRLNLLIEFLGDLFHRLLDAGGMDSAVLNQPFEGETGDFPSHGIEARKNDDFGRIVDDEFDSRCVFDGADVAPFPTDDARLHVVAGKRDDGNGRFRSVIGRAALDRKRNNVFRVEIRLVLRLLFDIAHLHRAIAAGFV